MISQSNALSISVEVKRSPARISWMIMVNGVLLNTTDTRREAEEQVSIIKRKYGL